MHLLKDITTAAIICPFPGSPDPVHAALEIEDRMSLTAADLRAVRDGINTLPLPWFDVSEQHNIDEAGGRRWAFSYVNQTYGPFIAGFTITGDGTGFTVYPDDGERLTAEWSGFQTVGDAISAIWSHIDWMLADWGLEVA